MSLDVCLQGSLTYKSCSCPRCGNEHYHDVTEEVFEANTTHNLIPMADAAGIYEVLWIPEEIGITHARQLIEPLRAGLARLRASPEHFAQFNAPNGWGQYQNFVPWVAAYLEACEASPDATVTVSR